MPNFNHIQLTTYLQCLQINLRHRALAATALAQLAYENNFDVIFLQEPYATGGNTITIHDIPVGYVAYHALDFQHNYGAAIIMKLDLATRLHAANSSTHNHVAAVDLQTPKGQLRFISAYLRPKNDVPTAFMTDVRPQINANTVLCIDSNGKNKAWNSSSNDRNGRELEKLFHEDSLNIENKPLTQLKFIPPSTSFLDITLTGPKAQCIKWLYSSYESLSDHPFIYFEISLEPSSLSALNSLRMKMYPKKYNLNALRAYLSYSINENLQLSNLPKNPTNNEIDQAIINLNKGITDATNRSQEQGWSNSSTRQPWWSKELWALRHKSNVSLKRWASKRTATDSAAYRTAKATYQREMRRAKRDHYRQFTQRSTSTRDIFSAINLLSGKTSTPTLPTTLTVGDKIITGDLNILKSCSDHFFPPEPPTSAIHIR